MTPLEREAEQRALSLADAQRAERLAAARFAAGATAVQPWLDQQRLLRDVQSADEQTRLDRRNNRMTLYRALGGGMS
ncbi:hypothetical protein WJ16_29400 [Burkholderia metallica]|nr:hypothetical protein WJ16_29400 [Burkholderia metallica]